MQKFTKIAKYWFLEMKNKHQYNIRVILIIANSEVLNTVLVSILSIITDTDKYIKDASF